MFDRDALQFYENGITSFNLPIAEHVIGARASRTTHPRVLASFSRLFSLLLQRNIMVENRFLWLTKSDVVNVIQEHGCSDLIAQTTSCANVRSLAMTTKQCGVCSQCIERRFAVLASGLADSESSDSYAVELFTGAHTKAEDLTMVEQYIARAQRLACLSENAFLADYGQVFRALPYIQGPAAQNATKIFELHRRYGRGTIDVVDNQLKAHLNQIELSRRWSISPRTLERWRWLKAGPRYLKIGGRVVYRLEDVEAYEAGQLHLVAPAAQGRRS
jgi:hypothetical protein